MFYIPLIGVLSIQSLGLIWRTEETKPNTTKTILEQK